MDSDMPSDRHHLQRPERVKEYVEARCAALGMDRADVADIQRPEWKERLGTWTYDSIVKLKGQPLVKDKLRKLSLALGWESDGIERIDAGLEPVEEESDDPIVRLLGLVTSIADEQRTLSDQLQNLERQIAALREPNQQPPAGGGEAQRPQQSKP